MSQSTQPRALIIAPAWVGDMVMAHTLVQLLARAFDQIEVAAPAATRPLAERMAEVTAVHAADFAHGELGLARRYRLGRELADQHYSAAFVLPNSWKSALVPFFARIPRRTGWHGEARFGLLNDRRRLDEQSYPLMIERFMALADPAGALPAEPYPRPVLQADPANSKRLIEAFDLDTAAPVALCPGAEFGAAKKWPVEHYATVAEAALQAGRPVWLLGSPKDAADCAQVAAAAPGVTDLSGKTSLLDAVDLLSMASAVVCNDSGLMHVACALDVPTVGVFGSTSPGFTPPLGPRARVVELELDCRPCFQRECPLHHLNCLRQLQPAAVLAELSL